MASLNLAVITGRLGKDIEVRYTPAGKAVCEFSLAVSDYNNNTDWIDCVAWEKRAEVLFKHTQKGDKITVQGSLKKQEWQTSEGQKRYKTYILISHIELMGEKKEKDKKDFKDEKTPDLFNDANPFSDDDIPF